MGIQIDLIIPPIIVGLLVIVIFRLNAFIMETSVDNRLTNDMQNFSEVATRIIQEELKSAVQIERPANPSTPDSVLQFIAVVSGDTVNVKRDQQSIEIVRINSSTAASDTVLYPLNISSLSFDLERKPAGAPIPYYLNIRIQTESNPDYHATMQGEVVTVRGFSETEVYLRNVHLSTL